MVLPASDVFAQQGPAGLWAWTGVGDDEIVAFDETGALSGGTIEFSSLTGSGPEAEYTGNAFVITKKSGDPIEVWDADTATLTDSLTPDYSSSSIGANVLTGLEFVGGTMFAAAAVQGNAGSAGAEFGTFDIDTGVYTAIGHTGISSPLAGLAFDGTSMYAVEAGGVDASLYTIDLLTGLATLEIAITDPFSSTPAPEFSSLEFGADGLLYATKSTGNDPLGTIDTTTGVFTPIGFFSGNLTGTNALTSNFLVPEPASATLLGLGGLLLARRRRRGPHTQGNES